MKIPTALKWRYDLYCAEYVDLYGSFGFYLKHKFENFQNLKVPTLAYLYANKRNVGDYISFRGINYLLGNEGIQLFSSPVWERQLVRHVKLIKSRNPECLLVIGGGGLLQPIFKSFWEIIISSNLPYVLFGVGVNTMPGRPELSNEDVAAIVNNSRMVGVRDLYTLEKVKKVCDHSVFMGACPSINFVCRDYWNENVSSNSVLLNIYHPSDIRLAGADFLKISNTLKVVAGKLNLDYFELNNMTTNFRRVLDRVNKSRIVVSSRLHGCIMSYAMGIPFVPLYCDEKIKSFNMSHVGVSGYSPDVFHNQDQALVAVQKQISSFNNQREAVLHKIAENENFAKKVSLLISYTK